jgi:hypothetical protein
MSVIIYIALEGYSTKLMWGLPGSTKTKTRSRVPGLQSLIVNEVCLGRHLGKPTQTTVIQFKRQKKRHQKEIRKSLSIMGLATTLRDMTRVGPVLVWVCGVLFISFLSGHVLLPLFYQA